MLKIASAFSQYHCESLLSKVYRKDKRDSSLQVFNLPSDWYPSSKIYLFNKAKEGLYQLTISTRLEATHASIARTLAVSSNLFVLSTYAPAIPEQTKPPMMTRAPHRPAMSYKTKKQLRLKHKLPNKTTKST